MKYIRYSTVSFVFISSLFLSLGAKASTDGQINEWKTRINKILRGSKISKTKMSIYINDNPQGVHSIFALNESMKVIPASVTKLVTSAVALDQMPPGTTIATQLLSSAKVEDAQLKGDLYLKGGGDPSFVSESMWVLVNNFLRQKITSIEGDIVVDDSLFDESRFDASREDKRVDRAYDAPTGAMSFNWNSVNIYVRPGKSEGEAASVFADPENEYIQLKADVKTSAAGSTNKVVIERDSSSNGGDTVTVKGKIAADSKELAIYKNVTHPDIWSGYNLKSFLKQRGIHVTGKIRSGLTPPEARLMAEFQSKPIEHILADMNKFSNNYVAEMLAKGSAAKVWKPGTIAKFMEMSKDYMKKIGVPTEDFELKNPSGLTRENKLTAYALWKVLNDLKNHFEEAPELMSSLPIAGIDGTLKRRFTSLGERQIRAKTGSLNGVVSFAGYISGPGGAAVPFVMIYNGSDDESDVRALFDKMSLVIAN